MRPSPGTAAGDQIIDLHGRTVIPGIVDSHLHMLFGAYALHALNLTTPAGSITAAKPDELVARLKDYAASHPKDPVLLARADFSAAPPSTPTTGLLDRAVPDRPVVVHNSSEHSLWVNSAALRLAGITDYPVADAQEERGIIRDASGRPQGVLIEAGMEVMERAVAAQIPEETKLALLEVASHYLNSLGITSVVNATGEHRGAEALRDAAGPRQADRAHAHRLRCRRRTAPVDAGSSWPSSRRRAPRTTTSGCRPIW